MSENSSYVSLVYFGLMDYFKQILICLIYILYMLISCSSSFLIVYEQWTQEIYLQIPKGLKSRTLFANIDLKIYDKNYFYRDIVKL